MYASTNNTTLTYGVKKSVLLHPPLHDYDHSASAAGGNNSNFQNSIISRPSRAPIIEVLIGNLLQFKDSNRRKRQHIQHRKAMLLYAKTQNLITQQEYCKYLYAITPT